jgi:hypothetical protein
MSHELSALPALPAGSQTCTVALLRNLTSAPRGTLPGGSLKIEINLDEF